MPAPPKQTAPAAKPCTHCYATLVLRTPDKRVFVMPSQTGSTTLPMAEVKEDHLPFLVALKALEFFLKPSDSAACLEIGLRLIHEPISVFLNNGVREWQHIYILDLTESEALGVGEFGMLMDLSTVEGSLQHFVWNHASIIKDALNG